MNIIEDDSLEWDMKIAEAVAAQEQGTLTERQFDLLTEVILADKEIQLIDRLLH